MNTVCISGKAYKSGKVRKSLQKQLRIFKIKNQSITLLPERNGKILSVPHIDALEWSEVQFSKALRIFQLRGLV